MTIYNNFNNEKTDCDTGLNEYIEWTEDFNILVRNITHDVCDIQKGHYDGALDILARALYQIYGETSYSKLYDDSSLPDTASNLSRQITHILDKNKLKQSTKNIMLYAIKKILGATSISPTFISRLVLCNKIKRLDKQNIRNCFPKKYKYLDDDNRIFMLLIGWVNKLRRNTSIKSVQTIKQILYYIIPLLKSVHLDIDSWDENYDKKISKLNLVCLKPYITNKRHIHYIKVFFTNVYSLDIPQLLSDSVQQDEKPFMASEDHDMHRISVDELERIYDASKSNIRDELIILLLTTTGMRIGGLANIKLQWVSDISENRIIIKDSGRTIEKNNKWFTFNLNSKVKSVLWDWIMNYRKANFDCEHLFVGRGGALTTNRIRELIKNVVKRAGLEGAHLHPHSFRHTFAHMLLESGNNVECVAKMMGHSSSKTTETYYLKESAAEVSKRSNVPWLDSSNRKEKIIPDFLASNHTQEKLVRRDERKNKKRERNRQLKQLAKSFKTISSLTPITE
jgi:integrase